MHEKVLKSVELNFETDLFLSPLTSVIVYKNWLFEVLYTMQNLGLKSYDVVNKVLSHRVFEMTKENIKICQVKRVSRPKALLLTSVDNSIRCHLLAHKR